MSSSKKQGKKWVRSEHEEEVFDRSTSTGTAPTLLFKFSPTWRRTFGLPGDSITAIVLGAMLMYGLRPGPMIFTQSRELVTQLFAVAILAQILLIPIGWLGIKMFSLFVRLKTGLVMTAVTIFCIVGSYALRNSVFDVYVMFVFGLIGYAFERLGIPLAPMILGLILGRTIEDNLRVGLIKTKGDFLPFLARPISLVLFVMILFVLIVPPLMKVLRRKV